MGPSVPAKTIVCPSFKVPFTKQMSIVVPKPGMALTSKTVAYKSKYFDRYSVSAIRNLHFLELIKSERGIVTVKNTYLKLLREG